MARREAADTVQRNLRRAQKREVALWESKLLFADEICAGVLPMLMRDLRAGGRPDLDTMTERLSAFLPLPFADPTEEEEGVIGVCLAASNGAFIAECCYKLSRMLENAVKKKNLLQFVLDAETDGKPQTVAMLNANTFSEIFSAMQKKTKGLTAVFGQSFAEVIEQVGEGSADACLLPVENNRDGVLISVWKSICAEDLFISRIFIKNDSSGINAKFALLCRGFFSIIESSENLLLYLRLVYNAAFHRLLTVLSVLHVDLRSTFSIPLTYTDGNAQICAFCGTNAALFSLLFWLRMMKVDATLLGICTEEGEE